MSADYTMMNPAQYLSGTLLPLFDKNEVTVVANTFFNAVADGNQGGQNLEHGNIYKEDDMEIEIATVHAVKGETHAATLYLETFFNKYYESERLKEQFKGITYMGTDDDTLKSLRVVYVGMSRPRYLLCVAIQKDRFHTIDCQELRYMGCGRGIDPLMKVKYIKSLFFPTSSESASSLSYHLIYKLLI